MRLVLSSIPLMLFRISCLNSFVLTLPSLAILSTTIHVISILLWFFICIDIYILCRAQKPLVESRLDCCWHTVVWLQKELIEYYYYWKKTPISTVNNRTGRRHKSNKSGGGTSKASSGGEGSSESEESTESYICFRCDTESKALQFTSLFRDFSRGRRV